MDGDKKYERKKQLKALTRQDILSSAISLLIREGVQGMRMDRVATEAGVAKGTLYVHFGNKEQLLESAIDASFDPLIKELSVLLDGDHAPDRKLAEYSLCHLQFFNEHRELIRILSYDREIVRSEKSHYTDKRYINIIQRVANVLDEGIRQKLFVPLNSMTVAAMFVEANLGVVMQRILDGIPGDIEKDVQQITNIFMDGLKRKKEEMP